MAVHELTTNAVRHGALSAPGGRVFVSWRIEPGETGPLLVFEWREREGRPVAAPTRHGFGSRLLQRVLTTQLQAEVNIDYDPAGLSVSMALEDYYAREVIGGPGAFVEIADATKPFAVAARRKLLTEVAAAPQPSRFAAR